MTCCLLPDIHCRNLSRVAIPKDTEHPRTPTLPSVPSVAGQPPARDVKGRAVHRLNRHHTTAMRLESEVGNLCLFVPFIAGRDRSHCRRHHPTGNTYRGGTDDEPRRRTPGGGRASSDCRACDGARRDGPAAATGAGCRRGCPGGRRRNGRTSGRECCAGIADGPATAPPVNGWITSREWYDFVAAGRLTDGAVAPHCRCSSPTSLWLQA